MAERRDPFAAGRERADPHQAVAVGHGQDGGGQVAGRHLAGDDVVGRLQLVVVHGLMMRHAVGARGLGRWAPTYHANR